MPAQRSPRELLAEQDRERRERCGLSDPDLTDRDAAHDEELMILDRLREKGSDYRLVARQPHPRERDLHREARQERDALLGLYPDRPVTSQVSPLGRKAA